MSASGRLSKRSVASMAALVAGFAGLKLCTSRRQASIHIRTLEVYLQDSIQVSL